MGLYALKIITGARHRSTPTMGLNVLNVITGA